MQAAFETSLRNAQGAISEAAAWATSSEVWPYLWGGLWAFGLIAAVLITIWAVAVIYSGSIQNEMYGPVCFRPHPNRKLGPADLRAHKDLLKEIYNGIHADCDIFYVYTDYRGRRKQKHLRRIRDLRVEVVPTKLAAIQDMRFGLEITDAIGRLDPTFVVIPTPESDPGVSQILETPPTVAEYVTRNNVLEAWQEDDDAHRVSVHSSVIDLLTEDRESFIVDAAEKVRKQRDRAGWWRRAFIRGNAKRGPSVIGSYYLRFKHSNNPVYILSRHPDRDLRMTAWLTVLTSFFAMLMEVVPLRGGPFGPPEGAVVQGSSDGAGPTARRP